MFPPPSATAGSPRGWTVKYWLLKTDPAEYAFDALLAAGRKVPWDGVRHTQALKYLGMMQKGDRALIYHSGEQRSLVGMVRVASNPYPDISNDDARFLVVDVDEARALPRPLPLGELRHHPCFADLPLVKNTQLTVMPLSRDHWETVQELVGALVPQAAQKR